MTFHTILTPTDFSNCARTATRNAMAFAQLWDADIDLLHASLLFQNDPNNPQKKLPRTFELIKPPEPYTSRQFEKDLEHGDYPRCKPVQIRGLTEVEAIRAYLAEHPVDLMIMGTHGRRGFKRWLLGSVAEELVRMAPCPVITVQEMWTGSLGNIKRIAVPMDFSDSSRKSLHLARQIAEKHGAALQLIHVVQEPYFREMYTNGPPKDLAEENESRARDLMSKMLHDEHGAVPAEIAVAQGHPAGEVVKFAETHKTDLIVMAHQGHSGIPERILGGNTEHVIRAAKCPVLTFND